MTDWPFHGWQDSLMIRAALLAGRQPEDIAVVVCYRCGSVVRRVTTQLIPA
jgi:hypothetical protein